MSKVNKMRVLSKVLRIIIIGLIFIISGCSEFVTFGDRTMTIEDIIKISKTKLDSEIIIRQIEITHSKFKLETQDIIRLKNEGVEDDVIEYMIGTDFTPDRFSWEYGYTPYEYSYYYFNSFYYPYTYNTGSYYPNYDDYYYRMHYYPYLFQSNIQELMQSGHRIGRYYYQPGYSRYNPFYPPSGRDYFPGRYHYRWDRYRKPIPDEYRTGEYENSPEE